MSEESKGPATKWVPTYPLIRQIDAIWFQAERVMAAAMFLLMGLMMFATVVTEVFSPRRGWTDISPFGWHLFDVRYELHDVIVLFGVTLLAVRTRAVKEGERKPAWPISLAIAAGITAVLAGAVYVYVENYPGGFIWAQKLALVLMMWVALIGASMATYDRSHLALEMGEKIWPAKALRFVKAFAHAVTSAFCVGALVISIHLVTEQRSEGHTIADADWLSTWQAFLVVPYAFAMMAVRFLAQGLTTVTDTAEPMEERLPT